MKLILACLFFCTLSAFAARDTFAPIDGQNYYEVLGCSRVATAGELRSAYVKLIARHHPDHSGDLALAQKVNLAYATLKNPEARARYNRWLGPSRSAEEDRLAGLDTIMKNIMRAVAEHAGPRPSIESLVAMGRGHILYHQRFLEGAQVTVEDLTVLLRKYIFASEWRIYTEEARIALAGGVFEILAERIRHHQVDEYRAQMEWDNVLKRLTHALNSGFTLDSRQYADQLWKLMHHGRSFYAPEPTVTPAQACEQYLKTQVRDQNGRLVDVTIGISIKLGP